jgi:hypothetical protein
MSTITVVGPLDNQDDAIQTSVSLGVENHSVYSRSVKDADGYDTNKRLWFVERDTSVIGSTTFGYDTKQLMARQYK